MNSNLAYFGGSLAFALPFLAIAAILVHYHLRRAAWKIKKRRGKEFPGFCPPSTAFATILLFAQMLYRPNVSCVIEARQDVNEEEDDQGDPVGIVKQLHRQIRKNSAGEPTDTLILRL